MLKKDTVIRRLKRELARNGQTLKISKAITDKMRHGVVFVLDEDGAIVAHNTTFKQLLIDNDLLQPGEDYDK